MKDTKKTTKAKTKKLLSIPFILPTLLFTTNLVAGTEGSLMYKAQEQNFKSAKKLLPPLIDHHSTIKDMLKESLVPEAVDLVMQTQDIVILLEDTSTNDVKNKMNETLSLAQKLNKKYAKDDHLVVDFGVEIFNRAPYELDKIKALRKELHQKYSAQNFPETRAILSKLASELHMQTYHISSQHYVVALNEAIKLLDENKRNEAALRLNSALSKVMVEDWSVPLPFIEAETALMDAEKFKDEDREKAKNKIDLAQYQIERAEALGYVANDKKEYQELKEELKTIKKEIFKKEFNLPNFKELQRELIAFIKKHMLPKKAEDNKLANEI